MGTAGGRRGRTGVGYTERWIGEPTLAASVHTQCETTQGGLVSTNGVFGQEAALVEFTALRGEILGRQAHQHTLLALQLTIAGAIYSFALSGPGRTAVLLVIPFSTYMLASRYIAHSYATLNLGRYIREQLSGRVEGGLGWEQWLKNEDSGVRLFRGLDPLFISFPGVAALSLAGALPYVFRLRSPETAVWTWAIWAAGMVLSILTVHSIWKTRRHFIWRAGAVKKRVGADAA